MVLFLIMRFVVVALRNFVTDLMLGYVTFYDVATLIPEVVCCIIMLAIVLFTLYQSKPLRLKTMLSKTGTGSTYAPTHDSEEMMEHLLPGSGTATSHYDDRYEV